MKSWQTFHCRFKTPLVRGVLNTQLDQFQKIEGLISSDLDHWLCNLYFQVCLCVIWSRSHLFRPKDSYLDSLRLHAKACVTRIGVASC